MIRYRRLNENKDFIPSIYIEPEYKLYDTIDYAGHEWYIINIDGDVVTLLAKNADFGKSALRAAEGSTDYMRGYLKDQVLPKLRNNGANPIASKLNGERLASSIWLLSSKEAKNLPNNIRKLSKEYWLRDGYIVNKSNDTEPKYFNYDLELEYAVRPAMKVNLLSSETTEDFEPTYYHIELSPEVDRLDRDIYIEAYVELENKNIVRVEVGNSVEGYRYFNCYIEGTMENAMREFKEFEDEVYELSEDYPDDVGGITRETAERLGWKDIK